MDENTMEPKKTRKRLLNATLKGCTRLNVRSGPSADANVVGVVTSTDRLKVDPGTRDRAWVSVHEPIRGYVKKEYIEVK